MIPWSRVVCSGAFSLGAALLFIHRATVAGCGALAGWRSPGVDVRVRAVGTEVSNPVHCRRPGGKTEARQRLSHMS